MSTVLPTLFFVALVASGPQLDVTVRGGGRTAPESAVEGPEPDEGAEPAALLSGDVSLAERLDSGLSLGIGGSFWIYAPEPDVDVFRLEPWVGYAPERTDDHRFTPTLAARYRWESFPWVTTASSGRGEVLLGGHVGAPRRTWALSVQGIDRRYFDGHVLDFRAASAGVEVPLLPDPSRARLGLWVSGQVNEALSPLAEERLGWQGRVGAQGSLPLRRATLGFSYRFYLAAGGEGEGATRRQFDPFGDYADDADALSVGGFTQHRLQLDGSAFVGPWTLGLFAMSRVRSGEGGESTFALTLHTHGTVSRQIGRGVEAGLSLGVSDVRYADGGGFTDVYGWLGLSRRFDLGHPPQDP